MIRIIKCKTGLPEKNFRVSGCRDFPGQTSTGESWSEDTIYRVVCDKCGLVDKRGTRNEAEITRALHRH